MRSWGPGIQMDVQSVRRIREDRKDLKGEVKKTALRFTYCVLIVASR